MDSQVSLAGLFELGTHRGNSRSKLNSRLKKRIFGFTNGLCVVDLVQTIDSLTSVSDFLYKLGQKRRQVIIIGTSDHIKDLIPDFAKSFNIDGGMPFVNNRWLGGTLTNWSTVKKTLKTLEKLESYEQNEEFYKKLARNEQLNIQKEKTKITKFFAGLKNLKNNHPGAVLLLDAAVNPVTIKEAQAVKVPVIAFTNTSIKLLPDNLDTTVVCNVNSTNTVKFLISTLSESYNKGLSVGIEMKEEAQKETKVKE